MSKMNQDLLVGIVFFVGMILIGIFTIVIKDLPTLKGTQGSLSVIFDKVSGLEEGHKVLASGMEVGQVTDLKLLDDGKVKVKMNLTHPVKLRKDYKISVVDTSALGGKHVSIDVGSVKSEVIPLTHKEAELRPLDGYSQPSILNDPNVQGIINSAKNIARKIDEGQGTIGLLINERKIYDNIVKAAANIKEITDQMKNSEGTIGKLINDPDLYNRVANIVKNIEDITLKIKQGKGTIGRLVNDASLYKNANDTLKDVRKVAVNLAQITEDVKKGKGTIGKLFQDEKVYNDLDQALVEAKTMMKNLNDVVTEIKTGKGTLGVLLRNEELAQNLKETMANIKIVTNRLKKGEGTIGKLLADETLYKEIRRVVKNFSDSLEDTREQAPITTFTGLLFKAF